MLAGRRQLSLDDSSRRRLRRQPTEVRPILAWQDSVDSVTPDKPQQVEVVAKKIGQPKPTPARPIRSPSTRAESCLTLSRRQVAERLRVGWSKSVAKEGQDKGRQNLNIFLNKSFESRPESPRTPELGNGGFRRPRYFLREEEDADHSDSTTDSDSSEDARPTAVLEPPPKPSPQPAPTPGRPPLSASARRAVFKATGRQKPTTSSPEPPRPRLMSAPPQPPPRPLSAERSRSAPLRRPRRGGKSKPRRGVEGGEVITMVSLVSPAESEEEELTPNVQCPPTPEAPPSPERVPVSNPPPPPILSFRRPPKAVTFKSGAAEGPQFKTSYPGRPATILQEESDDIKNEKQPEAKKEIPASVADSEKPSAQKSVKQISPQPKIAKALRPTLQRVTTNQDKREDSKKKPVAAVAPKPIKEEIATEIIQKIETLKMLEVKKEDRAPKEQPAEDEDDPDFKSAKEKECWQLFKRVSSRGVSVSFETVLRGLLTPTEYRLRRAALLASC